MGKPTGFLDYERVEATAVSPKERIKNLMNFIHLCQKMSRESRVHAAWTVACHSASLV